MKNRNGIRAEVSNCYRSNAIIWLRDYVQNKKDVPEGFPRCINLGAPANPDDIQKQLPAFESFCKDWSGELSAGKIEYIEKEIKGLGLTKIPMQIVFNNPVELATWAGHLVEYNCALARLDTIAQKVPELLDSALKNIFTIASFDENDFDKFISVSKWLIKNPNSGSLIRQIPVRGVDTKWFESYRQILLDFLRDKLNLNPLRKDLLQLGLLPPPSLVSMVLLDHSMRSKIGGVKYFAISSKEMSSLGIRPNKVVFMDSLNTALSLPDIPGVLVIIVNNLNIKEVCQVEWVQNAKSLYFGSISLRSLAILNNFRVYLPNIENPLINEETLCTLCDLWSIDDVSTLSVIPSALLESETRLYIALTDNLYGYKVKLDLEILPLSLIYESLGVKYSSQQESSDNKQEDTPNDLAPQEQMPSE